MEYCYLVPQEDELYHHGVKGMHWGIRRYQNANGSLTSEGKAKLKKYKEKQINRVSKGYDKTDKRLQKYASKLEKKRAERIMERRDTSRIDKKLSNVSLNRNINTTMKKAAIAKVKKMKISDIGDAKKQRAAYIAKKSLKSIGALALGAAAGTAGAALGASALSLSGQYAVLNAGIGAGVSGATRKVVHSPKFTNLTQQERLAIFKKYQKSK